MNQMNHPYKEELICPALHGVSTDKFSFLLGSL